LPVPMKQPHQVPPLIVCVVIVKMESTKPMVLLLDPVVIFVRLGLRLRPSPPVAPRVLDQRTKLKMLVLLLPVPIIPPALLERMEVHPRIPSTERAPIVHHTNFKHQVRLLELHAHRGPPALPGKGDPHHPLPSIVNAPHVPIPNTKRKQHSPVNLARIGPHAMLGKKDPRHLCSLIGFVPIVTRANFKPRVHRQRSPVLFVLLENVL
jgi:hypothetical protein